MHLYLAVKVATLYCSPHAALYWMLKAQNERQGKRTAFTNES